MKTRKTTTLLGALALCLATVPAAAATDSSKRKEEKRRDAEAEEEEKDEFGDEIVWLDARGGYTWLDMVTFQASDGLLTAGLVPTSAGGPTVGVGLGVRLWFFTLGPRATVAMFDSAEGLQGRFNLWSIDGELGLRIPLGRVEPHFILAAGYSAVGGIDDAVAPIGNDFEIEGANVRAGAGIDVYITPNVSVGADVSGEVLALTRPGVPISKVLEAQNVGTINQAEAEILEADGASTGAALTLVGGVGFHF